MNRILMLKISLIVLSLLILSGCSQAPPENADEIIARSVKAHGGEKLSDWETLSIEGTIEMRDGIIFNAAYILLAQKNGKLKVEHDLTADNGRRFIEYFMNDGLAWRRTNLMRGRGNLQQMKQWFNECYGISYYADNAEIFILKEDAQVEWKEKPDKNSQEYNVIETKPAYVVAAVIGQDTTDLYFDKKNFLLLQESKRNSKRIFWAHKKFSGVNMPTKINQITVSRRGEDIVPVTYSTVEFNNPIEDWVFEEDKPESGTNRQ
ncbi:hypothetical protein ACFL7D_07170 [candidate division KSB1 bacterium]